MSTRFWLCKMCIAALRFGVFPFMFMFHSFSNRAVAQEIDQQEILNVILERTNLNSSALSSLDLNHDGIVDVADVVVLRIKQGPLPKAGVWSCAFIPFEDYYGGNNQCTMQIDYDTAKRPYGFVSSNSAGFFAGGGILNFPRDQNSPLTFKALVEDNTIVPTNYTALGVAFTHTLILSNAPSVNPFAGTDIIVGEYEDWFSPLPLVSENAHLATKVTGAFIMKRMVDDTTVSPPELEDVP